MADNLSHSDPLHIESEFHLLDYLHVVQRRWRIALIVFLLVFIGVAVATFLQVPVYQAAAQLRIGYQADASAQVLRMARENRFSVQSEIQVLRSYAIAEKAAEKLPFEWLPETKGTGVAVHLRRLDVPETFRQLELELTGSDSYRLRDEQGQELLAGTSGELAEQNGLRAVIFIQAGRQGEKVPLQRISRSAAVSRVSSGVSVRELSEGTNILVLSVQGPDPLLAADAANALAEAYYENSRSSRTREATAVLDFIKQQLGGLGAELDRSEQAYQEFRISTGLERLSPEGQSMVDAAVILEKQRAELTLNSQRINHYLQENDWTSFDFTAVEDLPGVNEYVKQLLDLRATRIEMLRKYTPAHPEVAEVDAQMHKIREQIFGAATLAKNRISQQLKDIEASLAKSNRRLEQFPEEELELVRLSRANQVNAELYSYLLQRQQEARIQAASTSGNVEIIDRAQVPLSPISPNRKKQLTLGLLLGALLGISLTFLLDYLDRTIKDEDDVQAKLGLPIIGTIPRIPSAEGAEEGQLITHLEPMSAAAEAFLALRTNLLYTITNQKHKTVMLTSCMPDEGKSTIAVNLAATLAQTGSKTLLVGCDLRRPSLYKALGETEIPGLTDLLVHNDKAAVRTIANLGLNFVPAGTEPPNPTQLLNSERMEEFLADANRDYDYVILDVPPLLPVADALIIASRVDLNVLVIESCRIPEKIARRALSALQKHGATIAGVVLNDKSGKGAKYHGAYSYYDGKYYKGYYRRNEPEPVQPFWRRVLTRVWGFING